LELVVAVAVLAVIGAAAYTTFVAILDAHETTRARAERLAAVQSAVHELVDDLRQTLGRDVRASQPAARDALTTAPAANGLIAFTRGGVVDSAERPASTLARITWRLDGDRLVRVVRPRVDARTGTGRTSVVLEDVRAVTLHFRGGSARWHEQWPPLNASNAAPLPRGVRVVLDLVDWREVRRVVSLPQPASDHVPAGQAP
jgi:type II secretion system protein J